MNTRVESLLPNAVVATTHTHRCRSRACTFPTALPTPPPTLSPDVHPTRTPATTFPFASVPITRITNESNDANVVSRGPTTIAVSSLSGAAYTNGNAVVPVGAPGLP